MNFKKFLKKNYFQVVIITFVLFLFNIYLEIKTQNVSSLIHSINNIDLSNNNYASFRVKYQNIPNKFLKTCVLITLSNNYETEHDCNEYTQINILRNFVIYLDNKYIFKNIKNKNTGYYTLYAIKQNGTFSEAESNQIRTKLSLFIDEYYKLKIDWDLLDELNKKYKTDYLAYVDGFKNFKTNYTISSYYKNNRNLFDDKLIKYLSILVLSIVSSVFLIYLIRYLK